MSCIKSQLLEMDFDQSRAVQNLGYSESSISYKTHKKGRQEYVESTPQRTHSLVKSMSKRQATNFILVFLVRRTHAHTSFGNVQSYINIRRGIDCSHFASSVLAPGLLGFEVAQQQRGQRHIGTTLQTKYSLAVDILS